jgi:hypothetical protein
MCKAPHLKTLPAVFMLVLFLVVSFFGSEGTLICFGKDGHMAVEFVDDCNSSGFDSQVAGMENDSCGPCRDVQFLSSPAYTNSALHYTKTLPLISSSPVLSSLPQEEYPRQSVLLQASPHHKTLASLHSVVLLI